MKNNNPTHRAKCPHCLGELEKRYHELGDCTYVCVDCKKTVPVSEFQYVPIEEHFNRVENNRIKEVTLNKVEAKDKKEETPMIARCRLCGRKLTVPKSVRRGVGPVCYKKLADELWETTERDMSPEPITQDEEWVPIGNGDSKEQDAIEKVLHKMR